MANETQTVEQGYYRCSYGIENTTVECKFNIPFSSNGKDYIAMEFLYYGGHYLLRYYYSETEYDSAANEVEFLNQNYRTIYVKESTVLTFDEFGCFDIFTAISAPVRKFTRLYIGDVAYSSGGKCFKRLTTEEPKAESENYLTFSSPNSFTLATANATKNWDGALEYSTDTKSWNIWDGTTTLSADGGKLYLRGIGSTYITGNNSSARWALTGSDISCIGNIENLLDYATVANGEHPTMANACYAYMFRSCSSLIVAPELPATTLTERCYGSMFEACTNLTTAPELPATTLAEICYYNMFSNCKKLTTAPELPATTLADMCYYYMFSNCTNLTAIPELPATTLKGYCYSYMFYLCAGVKISTTQTGEYQTAYRIPTSGTGSTASSALSNMFNDTGGTFTGTPEINTTYYTSNTVIGAEEPSETITDLTGTTWSIPSGWTATAGYGQFNITGSVSYLHLSNNVEYTANLKGTADTFYIGFQLSGSSPSATHDGLLLYATSSSGSNYLRAISDTYQKNIVITITGGTDVTNADLISWLQTYGELQ